MFPQNEEDPKHIAKKGRHHSLEELYRESAKFEGTLKLRKRQQYHDQGRYL